MADLFTSRGWCLFWLAWSVVFGIYDFAAGSVGWGLFMTLLAGFWVYQLYNHPDSVRERKYR